MSQSTPWFGIDARRIGAALTLAGFALLTLRPVLAAAVGVELIAAAFLLWARASDDAIEQVPRWGWIRRPANALWLAYAIQAVFPALDPAQHGLLHASLPLAGANSALARDLSLLGGLEAAAIVWAGLELLAALPLTRPFSDLPGPFLSIRPWLPVLLPAAGFLVLWRHDAAWIGVERIQRAAVLLLALTALLAALRAFARRAWVACLRWLVIIDCALGALLVASGSVGSGVSLMLWLAAFGAHTFLLAGELRGSAPRRGAGLTRLWRMATWFALAALAWPAAVATGPSRIGFLGAAVFFCLAVTTALAAWLSVARLVRAEERRRVMRPGPAVTMSHVAASVVLVLVPAALLRAWWTGFEPGWITSAAALAPVVVGGWLALLARQRGQPLTGVIRRVAGRSRGLARSTYDIVIQLERRLMSLLGRGSSRIMNPLHDLHTGDAQEYLLFLVGLGVLAVVLPLLR
jgi:hypothetical protein